MAVNKKTGNNKYWQGCGEKETLIQYWLVQPPWKTAWSVLKKIKVELPWSNNSTSGYGSAEKKKTTNLKRYIHPMFITAWFTITKIGKQHKCPSIDDWIKKCFYTHTNTYIHTHAHTHTHTQWNNIQPLKRRNLSICINMDGPQGHYAKRNKSEKNKYSVILFICRLLKNSKITEQISGCQRLGLEGAWPKRCKLLVINKWWCDLQHGDYS